MNESRFEVLVVGGGVIGLACAERLSRKGQIPPERIALVEREALGRASSTWASGGMLCPLPPDQCPEPIRALYEESLALYPDWCAALKAESGIDPEYWQCGALYRKDGQEQQLDWLAQVRSPRLLQSLVETLRRRGVRLFEHCEVQDWIVEDGELRGARTSQGELHCRSAVLAAGAWSEALGAEGMGPAKGQMLLLRAEPGALPQIIIGEGGYLIPRRDGRVLVGSTVEDAGFDTQPTAEVAALLRARAEKLWPAAKDLELEQHWVGLRPKPSGEAPLIGAHPGIRHLLLATGHFRIGVTLAPATAERIAALLL